MLPIPKPKMKQSQKQLDLSITEGVPLNWVVGLPWPLWFSLQYPWQTSSSRRTSHRPKKTPMMARKSAKGSTKIMSMKHSNPYTRALVLGPAGDLPPLSFIICPKRARAARRRLAALPQGRLHSWDLLSRESQKSRLKARKARQLANIRRKSQMSLSKAALLK